MRSAEVNKSVDRGHGSGMVWGNSQQTRPKFCKLRRPPFTIDCCMYTYPSLDCLRCSEVTLKAIVIPQGISMHQYNNCSCNLDVLFIAIQ